MTNFLIIPDIHGQITQYEKTERLIFESISASPDIHMIFLGDYIDRGSGGEFEYFCRKFGKSINLYYEDIGSRMIVERLLKLKEHFVENDITHTFLHGNHEHYFIENISILESSNNLVSILESKMNNRSRKTYTEMLNTIRGFTQDFDLMIRAKRFFQSMPLYFYDEKNNLFFTHAGVNPDKTLTTCDSDDYLAIREKFFLYKGTYPSTIIFGHTPFDSLSDEEKAFLNVDQYGIIFKQDRIGIDSGNYRGHPINLLQIKDSEFFLLKEVGNSFQTQQIYHKK
ncbi:MAG: metallophosphoesterase [Sulfuricurvum sp.]|nr:metallophosphoesterase [Sulfuricurvum sp.]